MNPFLDVLAVQFDQVPFPFEPLVRFVLHIRLELTLDLLAGRFGSGYRTCQAMRLPAAS